MFHLLSAVCFLLFVLLGWRTVYAKVSVQDTRRYRRDVTIFLLYSLVVSFTAGLTQRTPWPFASWPLISALVPATVFAPRLLAVDSAGHEHEVDARAWEPVPPGELLAWFEKGFVQLDAAAKARMCHYLVQQAERARQRAQTGKNIGVFRRFLGPLSAPVFHLRPEPWSRPGGIPTTPLVGLRIYKQVWDWQERLRHPEHFTRILIYEYPQP